VLRSFLLLILLATPHAFAGHAEASRLLADETERIICERLLERKEARQEECEIAKVILNKPYVVHFLHDMTPYGLDAFGISPNISQQDLRKMVLVASRADDNSDTLTVALYTFREMKIITAFSLEFKEPALARYEVIAVRKPDLILPYAQLTEKYADEGGGLVGYHSRPDRNGVRHFVTFDTTNRDGDGTSSAVEFGIDVPFALAEKYSTDVGELNDDLRTPAGHFRRLPVFGMARIDQEF
jgi:hypothetical protein